MLRMKRAVVAVMAFCLVGSLSWVGVSPAEADELDNAKAELSRLEGEAAKAAEEYNKVKAEFDTATAKLKEIDKDIEAQKATVAALRDQVTVVTLQQFQDRGTTTTAVLFTSGDSETALDRILMTTMVADATTALLQNYQLSQVQLDDLRRSQQAVVNDINTKKAHMKELKDKASKKVTEAANLVARLTAAQQAALEASRAPGVTSGASSKGGGYTPPPVTNGPAAQAIVSWAKARLGLGYSYGGEGPRSYDCSGFTKAAYASIGIRLPHSASSQYNYGKPVARKDLQPGDLVFFYGGPGHVGIYVGGGMIIDARNERVGVVYTPISYMPYVGARRLI